MPGEFHINKSRFQRIKDAAKADQKERWIHWNLGKMKGAHRFHQGLEQIEPPPPTRFNKPKEKVTEHYKQTQENKGLLRRGVDFLLRRVRREKPPVSPDTGAIKAMLGLKKPPSNRR